ncbi:MULTISPECIES: Yip1 family protein [Microbulbifer]|uniref:Yip1 family protein n=1 Tax=Microbulbifer TaxID=48073 RepID=UPI001E583823|nr:Yip1 family protein [Microbulbifer sp. YPW16]UHQ54833.1 YIP1 family protein [Microbulbifer sp. YPW16]
MRILSHTLGILTNPDKEWKAIRADKHSFAQVFLSHVPFLALIPCISGYIGVTQFGFRVGDNVAKLTPASAATLAILTYLAMLIGVYLFGEFINWMAKTYMVEGNEETRHYEGTALAVFVTTPIFLVGFIGLYPNLWVNAGVTMLAACYSIYLIYEGIPILMNLSKEQSFMYATSVVTVGLVLLVTVRVGSVILWSMGVGPIYQN